MSSEFETALPPKGGLKLAHQAPITAFLQKTMPTFIDEAKLKLKKYRRGALTNQTQ